MCEVTSENFADVFANIESVFSKCKFVSLDTEFSALTLSKNSLFDTPNARYDKMRKLCGKIIPVQVGLTAYTFHPDSNSYVGEMFTFYLFPRAFHTIKPSFVCQSESLQFLSKYNFDFNKFVYKGVSFLNRTQELEIRSILKSRTGDNFVTDSDLEHFLEKQGGVVSKWFYDGKADDKIILGDIYDKYKYRVDVLYYLHRNLRERFNNRIFTSVEDDKFIVRKVSKEEYDNLSGGHSLEETLVNDLLGFTRIYRLLVKFKKPLIGHNLLTDLMLLYQSFEDDLPKSYKQFKKNFICLFPAVYDTKILTHEVKNMLPDKKLWEMNTLQCLYDYFKDGYGRHAALNSPLISLHNLPEQDQFHNAGWDSYCTGYIFLRMAHILTAAKYEVNARNFMCRELFGSVEKMKNSVNLILCSISNILDGDDPVSRRPPCLIVESITDQPVDISTVTNLFGAYGLVEVKPYSSKGRFAIVAVDNFGSSRRILNQFRGHKDFHVKRYSFIKHSPVARAVLWSGVLTSGVVFAWLVHSTLK